MSCDWYLTFFIVFALPNPLSPTSAYITHLGVQFSNFERFNSPLKHFLEVGYFTSTVLERTNEYLLCVIILLALSVQMTGVLTVCAGSNGERLSYPDPTQLSPKCTTMFFLVEVTQLFSESSYTKRTGSIATSWLFNTWASKRLFQTVRMVIQRKTSTFCQHRLHLSHFSLIVQRNWSMSLPTRAMNLFSSNHATKTRKCTSPPRTNLH